MSGTALADRKPELDDVMLAMDVVDTLRHRERVVDMELGAEAREAALIDRLRDIYKAQGIEVPDRILADGVKALEEKRFVYEPPKGGVAISLAKFYVARDRWMKPVGFVLGLALFAAAVYEFGVAGPQKAAAARTEIALTQTLPANLESARAAALALAEADDAKARVETAYADGVSALAKADAKGARAALGELETLKGDLALDLTVRVVSRPGEYSGVFRIPDDAPDARNYYLIVEAVDARGRAHALEISSEEDQETKRVEKWGVRVPEGVFNKVAADKQDDQIIENAVVGRKPKGALAPDYGIDGAGGAILEW
ncbi:MAG: DUF6384 family protein [Pseudomonadota bacterium]|nr:DUF6384 family protein [Pseudomonadota bacterium]